jgi:type VI secretion system protein ImpA
MPWLHSASRRQNTSMDDSAGDSGVRAEASAPPTIVDTWLEPLPDSPCGEDLEYDDDFRAMEKAATGRPPSQFELEGVAPDWREVLVQSQALFERTRDLRVAIHWARARLRLDGASTLPEGLRLIEGLLASFWDTLHPLPDDGDAYARVNALNDMCSQTGLLGDLRESFIVEDRSIGELRGRDVEIALGTLESRADESSPGKSQVEQMLRDAVTALPILREFPASALTIVAALQQLMRDRVGYATAPELQPLVTVLTGLRSLMPGESAAEGEDAGGSDGEDASDAGSTTKRGSRVGLSGAIESRADALRAIDMVCEFLERTEPTNPAQLLLRRARKLVNKNFVQLVRELAPESLNEVARVMGISAEELSAMQAEE